jgi:2-dehydropantoate 2-reductase
VNGLEIVSPHGGLSLVPKAVSAGSIERPFDVVMLAVKGYSLDLALDDLAPAVGPSTMILSVLNGMRHVQRLQERFGEKVVVGSVCKITVTLDDEGRVVQLVPGHELAYGEMNGVMSARMRLLDSFMQGAGFYARMSEAIEHEMWEKWVLLATLGGVTCLMRGSIGEVEAAQGGADFVMRFLEEVVSVIRALGHPPSQDFLAKAKVFMVNHSSTITSMYRDLLTGRHVEADQIIGDLLTRAQSVGVATPLLAAAYTHLCVYEIRLRAQ